MRKLLLSLLAVSGLFSAYAADPVLNWAKLFDASNSEYTYAFASAADGGFLSFNSYGVKTAEDPVTYDGEKVASGSVTSTTSENKTLVIIKHNAAGEKQWVVSSKVGDFDLNLSAIEPTSDGGFVVAAKVRSTQNNGYVSPVLLDAFSTEVALESPSKYWTYNIVLFKLTAEGAISWTRELYLDELPVPNASSGSSVTSTTNSVLAFALTVDNEDNIYIGGNFRSPFIIGGEKNSHFVLQPRNLASYNGDTQQAAGGTFLVKLDKEGDYQTHLKVSGDVIRDQISGLTYNDGYVYFLGTVKGAAKDVVTFGDKSVTLENALDHLAYGRVSASTLDVDYFNYIKPFSNESGSNIVNVSNIRVIDGNLYLLGLLSGGLGVANDANSKFATATKTQQEGFLVKLNAADGTYLSGKANNGLNVGGYFDIFKSGNDLYLYGYRLNAATGVYIEQYADDNKWELVKRTSLILGGGAPATASNALFNSTTGNLIVSARGNNAFTFAGSDVTIAKPASWGSVIASFKVAETSGVQDVSAAAATTYSADKTGVIVKTSDEIDVNIYNAAGAQVASQKVAAGTSHIALPLGIYVVNGVKVIVG